MEDNSAVEKIQKTQRDRKISSSSASDSKRKRERTRPGAWDTHVQPGRTFDLETPEPSESTTQGRVHAADTQTPSASTSTTTPHSKRNRRAKATRGAEPTGTNSGTGTGIASDHEPRRETMEPGKGKGKLSEKGKGKQPARKEAGAKSNAKGHGGHSMGMAVNGDLDLDHEEKTSKNRLTAPAGPGRERGQGQRAEVDTQHTKAKSSQRKAPTSGIVALKKLVVSMKSANETPGSSTSAASTTTTGPRADAVGEPRNARGSALRAEAPTVSETATTKLPPVPQARISAIKPTLESIPTPKAAPAPPHTPSNPGLTPLNVTSNLDSRDPLQLRAEAPQFLHQLGHPSTSSPSVSAPAPASTTASAYSLSTSQVAPGKQPMQDDSRRDALPSRRDLPPRQRPTPSHHVPLPPYNTASRPNQGERERDSGMVNLSAFARTGFHDGGGPVRSAGVGRGAGIWRGTGSTGTGRGRGGHVQIQGSRQPAFPLSARTRVVDDTSYASRQVLQMREDVRRRVQAAVQLVFGGDYRVEIFGSTRYGVSFSDSDLDMVVIDPRYPQGYTETNLADPIYKSKKLANCIRRSRFIDVETRPRSTVPIVKFTDPITSLECDLNVNSTLGIINSDMIKAYISLYTPLKSLIFEIKEWAKPLGLNSPAGTREVPVSWSSYSLVGMAVAWCMNQGLLPNLQAGLPPLTLSTSSPSASSASRRAETPADAVMADARAEFEPELHLHVADAELTAVTPVVQASLSRGTTPTPPTPPTVGGQDQLVWTLKPHRGWDARYRPATAESVQAEMRAIEQAMGPERRGVNQLFAEWLSFWAKFDFEHQAVCIRLPGGIIDRTNPEVREATHRDNRPPAAICVVDPFIRTKNCTGSIVPKTLERFKTECAKEAMAQAAKAASGTRTGTGKSTRGELQRDRGGMGRGGVKY